MIKRIPLLEWAPDIGPFDPSYPIESMNRVVPTITGYAQALVEDTYISAGTTEPVAGFAAEKEGSKYFFIGEKTDIYRISATSTLDNVSVSAGGYSIRDYENGGRWNFVQWGDDVYAFSLDEDTSSMDVSATSFVVLSGATSATTIPRANTAAVVRNFLVVGNTYDSVDGTSPSRVRWPAIANPTDWVVSAATQADYQDLLGTGKVLRVFGGEYGVIFTERSIWRMSYIGTPLIWEFDEVQPGVELVSQGAAAQIGNNIYFLARDGFRVLRNGSESVQIGEGRVDEYTFGVLANSETLLKGVGCAIDPESQRVVWTFSNNGSGSSGNGILYDYGSNKWGVYVITNNPGIPVVFDNDHYGRRLANLSWFNTAFTRLYLLESVSFPSGDSIITTYKQELIHGKSAMVKSVTLGIEQEDETQSPDFRVRVWGMNSPYQETDDVTPVDANPGATSTPLIRQSVRKNGRYHVFEFRWRLGSPGKARGAQLKWADVEYVETHSR